MFAGVPVGMLEDSVDLNGEGGSGMGTLVAAYGEEFDVNPVREIDGEAHEYDDQLEHETPESILTKTNELIDELKAVRP